MPDQAKAPLSTFLVKDNGKEVNIYISSFHRNEEDNPKDWFVRTGQVDAVPVTMLEYMYQARITLDQAVKFFVESGTAPEKIYFNFMNGGDPFLNKTLMDNWDELSSAFIMMANEAFPLRDNGVKFNLMTIMTGVYTYNEAGTITAGYTELPFKTNKPEIYYGMYSATPEFRKRWLPRAQPYKDMLRILADYKDRGGLVRLQGGYILGHNDSLNEVHAVYSAAKYYRLEKKFNIVHLESPDETKWAEADMEDILTFKQYLENKGVAVQLKGFPV